MFEVILDNSFYSITDKIFNHLLETFDVDYIPLEQYDKDINETKFCVKQMFGTTTIKFLNEEDKLKFEEWLSYEC